MKSAKIVVLGMNHVYKFTFDAVKMLGVELVTVAGNDKLSRERASELASHL